MHEGAGPSPSWHSATPKGAANRFQSLPRLARDWRLHPQQSRHVVSDAFFSITMAGTKRKSAALPSSAMVYVCFATAAVSAAAWMIITERGLALLPHRWNLRYSTGRAPSTCQDVSDL